MTGDPLLTQTELDYIQQLTSTKSRPTRQRGHSPRLDISDQLGELLSRLSGSDQLSIDTHHDNEHLSFPLHLVQDDPLHSRLELGAPLITEQGRHERPWRLKLATPLQLLDEDDAPLAMQVLELSHNGMLVDDGTLSPPDKKLAVQLLLPSQHRIQLRAVLARRLAQQRSAYRLRPCSEEDEQELRQFLFEHHSSNPQQAVTAE